MSVRWNRVVITGCFLAGVFSELNHSLFQRVPWKGFTLLTNNISFLLIAVWALSAAELWWARLFPRPSLVLGTALLCVHSLVLAIGNNRGLSLFYMGDFIVAVFFLVQEFIHLNHARWHEEMG